MNTGSSVMFSTESDTYSKVFELSLDSPQNRPEVADSTRAIPQYIPTGLRWSATSPNNDFVIFSDQSDTLYTFKFYNGSEGRVLAGWSKWKFPAKCMFGEFDKDTLFTIGRHEGRQSSSRLNCWTLLTLVLMPASSCLVWTMWWAPQTSPVWMEMTSTALLPRRCLR